MILLWPVPGIGGPPARVAVRRLEGDMVLLAGGFTEILRLKRLAAEDHGAFVREHEIPNRPHRDVSRPTRDIRTTNERQARTPLRQRARSLLDVYKSRSRGATPGLPKSAFVLHRKSLSSATKYQCQLNCGMYTGSDVRLAAPLDRSL